MVKRDVAERESSARPDVEPLATLPASSYVVGAGFCSFSPYTRPSGPRKWRKA